MDGCEYDEEAEAVYCAMIRFFFKEDPDELDDVEFARRVKELAFLADEGFLKGVKL